MKEARRREQREAHLYMMAKVITNDNFRHYGGTDLCSFDANQEIDEATPRTYRVRKSMTCEDLRDEIAADIGQETWKIRLWMMVNRQNKTIRPDQPIMDLSPTVEEVYQRSAAHRDTSMRIWVEVADEVSPTDEPIWKAYPDGGLDGVVVKTDNILLFLKHFDEESQTLHGVSHVYIGKEKKVEDLVPLILEKMGWGEKLQADEKLLLWEVSGQHLVLLPRPLPSY